MPHDFRPGREPDPDPDNDDPKVFIESYLDCTGKKRKFRLQSYGQGMWLSATELLDGEAIGMRMVMKMDEHGHLPWGDIRDAIRRRLAERDVAVDPDTGSLEILRGLVRAQIERVSGDVDDAGPVLLVDDRRVTWRELGTLLATYEGWGLRLEISDIQG